jgi:hypothetical protein
MGILPIVSKQMDGLDMLKMDELIKRVEDQSYPNIHGVLVVKAGNPAGQAGWW